MATLLLSLFAHAFLHLVRTGACRFQKA
jgi:hypothetical protein